MRSKGDRFGRSLLVAIIGLVALAAVCFGLEIASPGLITPVNLSLGASGAALFAAFAAQVNSGRGRRRDEKTSDELDGLSQRLLRIENRLSALDGSGSRATSTITDMAGDVSALSEVVRDLAEALSTQERDLATLRSRSDRASATYRGWDPGMADNAVAGRAEPGTVVPSFFPSIDTQPPAERSSVPAAIRPEPEPLVRALDAGHIDLHVQPIVSLPQRRTRIYEVYALLRTGEAQVLVPEEFTPILDETGHLPELDAKVLSRAMSFARKLFGAGNDALVCCALSPATLRAGEHLARLQGILEADAPVASRIVLEVSQAAWAESGAGRGKLAGLREQGVTFCLGRVTDRELDAGALARSGVRLVKVPASDLLRPGNEDWAATLPLALARDDIRLVAERVVAEESIPELIDLDIGLAQGFAFAFPSPVDTVLAGLRPSVTDAAPAPGGNRMPSAQAEDRIPLRSFLKRSG